MRKKYLFLFMLVMVGSFQRNGWARTKIVQPCRCFGTYNNGRLIGNCPTLPVRGIGYVLSRVERQRNFGSIRLINYVKSLGRAVQNQIGAAILVGDLSKEGGGPVSDHHSSHRNGLDVDVALVLLKHSTPSYAGKISWEPMVKGLQLSHQWTRLHTKLLYLAAQDKRVDRIFVHSVIKAQLCQMKWKDRSWLRVLQPADSESPLAPNHEDHFHVRLQCPKDSPNCYAFEKEDYRPLRQLPEKEGCDILKGLLAQR